MIGLILLVGLVYNIQRHVAWLRENYERVNRQKIWEALNQERLLEAAAKASKQKKD